MPWRVKEHVELRHEFVLRASSGEPISALCREYSISRPTGYFWIKRFKESGSVRALRDKSHRPHSMPQRTEACLEEAVVKLRKKYGWGADKLRIKFKEQTNRDLARVTINRIIDRNGLLIAEDCHRPAVKRFERAHPNELWQIDLKGCMGRGEARCEPLSILDDHSRFVVGLHPTKTSLLDPIQASFLKTFETYGIPDSLLMDHGVPWWTTSNLLGLTRLAVWFMKQDITLHFSGYNHPQTQGKVERFHKTLAQAVRHKGTPTEFNQWGYLLEHIREEYNYERPHEALNMSVPATRYIASTRAFNPKPKSPEYPSGSEVVQVGTGGRFCFRNHRFFASEALRGELVRLVELENSLVVYYRKTPIREIDLRTGQSQPFSKYS